MPRTLGCKAPLVGSNSNIMSVERYRLSIILVLATTCIPCVATHRLPFNGHPTITCPAATSRAQVSEQHRMQTTHWPPHRSNNLWLAATPTRNTDSAARFKQAVRLWCGPRKPGARWVESSLEVVKRHLHHAQPRLARCASLRVKKMLRVVVRASA